MTLFVDVQGVPNAILELVQARILANRKRNKERASAAAAVKPEQPARRRYYSPVAPDRRPEPAGIPLGGVDVGMAWFQLSSQIDANDNFVVSVGSGNGKSWVDFTLNFPGYNDFVEQRIPVSGFAAGDAEGDQVTTNYPSYERPFVFPAGKDSSIVVYVKEEATTRALGVVGKVDNENDTPNIARLFGPINYVHRDMRACFVTHTSCKEVAVPVTFLNLLDGLMPLTTFNGPSAPFWNMPVGTPPPPGQPWPNFQELSIPMATLNGPNMALYPTPIEYQNSFNDPNFIRGGRVVNIAYKKIEFASPSMTSYGAAEGAMAISDPSLRFAFIGVLASSPVLYTLFQNPSVLLDLQSDLDQLESLSSEAVYNALRSSNAPAPRGFVTPDVRRSGFKAVTDRIIAEQAGYPRNIRALYNDPEDVATVLDFATSKQFQPQPSDTYPQVAAWRQGAKINFPKPRQAKNDPILAIYWDWGQPAYCRSQLLALGFTEEDLTP